MEQTKKWLNRAYTIDEEIKALEAELKKANLAATSLAAQRIGEKVQTSKVNNADCAILKCVEYSEQIVEKLGEMYATKAEINEVISCVDDGKASLLLRLRYLRFLSWEEIANEMNYSIRSIYNIRDMALEEAKEIIAHNFTCQV